MQRIVTNETIAALREMVTESFIMTARIDRMQSVLDADLSYNQTSLLIHNGMAHRYSGYFADEVADLGLQGYDISVNYGDVPTMNKSYSSVKELLYELRDYVIEYQTELNGCYKIAFNNNDFNICICLPQKRRNSLFQKNSLKGWYANTNQRLICHCSNIFDS